MRKKRYLPLVPAEAYILKKFIENGNLDGMNKKNSIRFLFSNNSVIIKFNKLRKNNKVIPNEESIKKYIYKTLNYLVFTNLLIEREGNFLSNLKLINKDYRIRPSKISIHLDRIIQSKDQEYSDGCNKAHKITYKSFIEHNAIGKRIKDLEKSHKKALQDRK